MQLTLLIPELIWPEPDDNDTLDDLACPALLTLLARSRLSRRDPQSLEATLTDLFGHGENAPYAAFRLLGEADDVWETGNKHWLCADPVHLRLLQERVVLADSRQFGIELDEAQILAAALNEHLGDACRFHVATADRWYLQVNDAALQITLDTPPLSAATGRNVERLLPETTEARPLRKLHTETQMLLHAHPLNTARETAGRMPINSLWFWGAGRLPARNDEETSRFDGVWSINPLATGLARAAGVPTHPLPVALANFLEHAVPESGHLIVVEDLLAPVQYENGADYRTTIADLERRWFDPLRAALLAGKIRQLRIEAPTAYAVLSWESRRSDQFKLWRRAQTLQALAGELAKP
ncbi:MAG: hypothetical protein ABI478_01475 [Propionivibrio sp.]